MGLPKDARIIWPKDPADPASLAAGVVFAKQSLEAQEYIKGLNKMLGNP
jgi:hypothetical protein